MKKTDLFAVKFALLAPWTSAAYATTITLGSSLAGVPVLAWLMVTVLSSISGLAALLGKLKDGQPERLRWFIASHMVGSVLAGVLTFFGLSGLGTVHDFIQVVLISIGAYAGASLLDAAADGLGFRARNLLGKYNPDDADVPPARKRAVVKKPPVEAAEDSE